MKADEVLKRYAAGERDFRCANLRGQSLQGKNLSGADFSKADIRGANFTNAYLKGAKFCKVKAGLQRRWAVFIVTVSLLFGALSGFICAINSAAGGGQLFVKVTTYPYVIFPAVFTLVTYLVFLSITISQGFQAALETLALIIIAVAIPLVSVLVTCGTVSGAEMLSLGAAGTTVLAGAFLLAVALVVAGTIAGILAVVGTGAVALAGGVAGSVVGAVTGGITGVTPLLGGVTGTVAEVTLSGFIGWQALAREEKYNWIVETAIAFAATGGTSFRNADLTNADLTSATLKSTDFRGTNITHTCWHHAKNLDRIRPGTTYLQDAKVRQLLITGQGQDQNFDRQNLRGVNLQGANLADASFIGADLNEANLQNADLSRAKLVQTQLDEVDLTGATLTGATIEDWNITSHTQLQGIRCRYVFMRLPTKDDPNPRRKPDNWEEEFEDGDFADFIKPIVDTLDLYHNQGIDPRAIAISFKQLAENSPEAELEIVAMEKRGKDKFLLRAATAPDADRSQLSAEYFATYNQIKALAEAEVQKLLTERDSRIASLENMVMTALQRPNFYTNIQVEQVGIMTNNPGGISQSNTGSMGGGQQAAIGDYNQQTMSTQAAASAGEQLSQQDVLQLLAELEQRINESEIPADTKEEAATYLSAAKKAIDKEEPNKERAKINLEGVAEELEKAGKVAEAGTTLFTKVKPILVKVASWLGAVAAGSFLGSL